MGININSFVIIAISFVFPYISLAYITNKNEELQFNEQVIKQLIQEYISTENSDKLDYCQDCQWVEQLYITLKCLGILHKVI